MVYLHGSMAVWCGNSMFHKLQEGHGSMLDGGEKLQMAVTQDNCREMLGRCL